MTLLLNCTAFLSLRTSATIIMAVLAMTPMTIQIQILVLMRSDAFKKPWSSVVETKD